MGRTSPPAAIVALPANAKPPVEASDLPLRNFPTSSTESHRDADILSSAAETTPGLSELETPNSLAEEFVPTPSSTMVEFDDDVPRDKGPGAIMMATKVSQAYLRSRSTSVASDTHSTSRSTAQGSTGRKSRSTVRAHRGHTQGEDSRARTTSKELVDRYLQSLPSIDPVKELSLENTSLHQRIAGLQRVERDLLGENHALLQQLNAAKRQNDLQRRKWRDEYREREKSFQARIKSLEERITVQDREMAQYAAIRSHEESRLSDDEVAAWFTERTVAWQAWVDDFVHHDPERIQSGIHPVQLLELCESVKSFVQLTDDGLPEELVGGGGPDGVKAAHVLLQAMLANFIISETLESPFWVFAALGSNKAELESPSVIKENSVSPIGFRMDLAMWNNVAPPRSARLPPMSARIMPEPPKSARHVPSGAGTPSLSLNTKGLCGSLNHSKTPGRATMEHFYRLLGNVQQNSTDKHTWRAQLMHTLADGGMALDHDNVDGDERRSLIDCRKIYSRKLAERFLGGAARFLLHDQDAAGIERLEGKLVQEIDAALRFSCRAWSRCEPLEFRGLKELAEVPFLTSDEHMQLCRGQAPAAARSEELGLDLPPAYHDGHTVTIVVQPTVESVFVRKSGKDIRKVVSKARVLVATPGPRSAYPKSEATPLTAKPLDDYPAISLLTPIAPTPVPASVSAPVPAAAASSAAPQLLPPSGPLAPPPAPQQPITSAPIPAQLEQTAPPPPPKDSTQTLLAVRFGPPGLSVPPFRGTPEVLSNLAYTKHDASKAAPHIAGTIRVP